MSKEPKEKKRIPFEVWINSQLSIARHFGGCKINGIEYRLDWDNAPSKAGPDWELLYFPDLVEQ